MTTSTLPPDSSTAGSSLSGAPEVVARARVVLGELGEVLWAARSAGELMETVASLEELKTAVDAVELAVIRELEAAGGVQPYGWASTKDFVTAVSGGHKGHGPKMVRLASALGEDPLLGPVAAAHRDGWLSTEKVNVITRGIEMLPAGTTHAQEVRARGVQQLLEDAKRLDASELRKAARRLVEVVDPDGEERREEKALDREERSAHLNRSLSIRDDGAGGAHIKGRCSAEDAALIRSALLPLSKPTPSSVPQCDPGTCEVPGCAHDGRDPRDHGARMLDALVEACRRLLSANLLPTSHSASARVIVTMDLDDLREQTGYGVTDTGEDLSAGTVRRMACDADLIPVVLGSDSVPLDVGRAMRLVTAAIWYALITRDQHCRFPGCTRPPIMCHAHHVRHWLDGGETSLSNLVLLCGHHHRLIHAGPWTITQPRPGVFEFTPPDAIRRARGPRPDRAPPTA